ncbi:MAG: hypothetical protein WCS56_00835 [Bacilli bacterium]
MSKKNKISKKKKEPLFTTKEKMDNSIEVTVNRNPAKSASFRVIVWIVCIFTFATAIFGVIYILIQAFK